jgi:hypothetical protein
MNYIKSKRKLRKMLSFFHRLGFINNFCFSNKEILGNRVIGLDKLQQKILIVERNDNSYHSNIINLHEIKSFKIKKIYADIKAVNFKNNRIEEYLKSISFLFNFKNEKTPLILKFFRCKGYSLRDMIKLDAKIRHWEFSLSKMLITQAKKAA